MMENKFVKVGRKVCNIDCSDETYNKIVVMRQAHDHSKVHRFSVAVTAMIIFCCLSVTTVFAFSADLRNRLAEKIGIHTEDTHFIGATVDNNGTSMTTAATHYCENAAMLLVTFTKDNGEVFYNNYAPKDSKIIYDGKVISEYFITTELSEDKKTMYCYYDIYLPNHISGKELSLGVNDLICIDSQTWDQEIKEQIIKGNWNSRFILEADHSNTIEISDVNSEKEFTMNGVTVTVDSVSLSQIFFIARTTIVSKSKIEFDPLSSQTYDRIESILITYKDGTKVKGGTCYWDNDNNIIAFFHEPISLENIDQISIGDIVLTL